MILSRYDGIKITGISVAVSNNWVSLTDFINEELNETKINKFIKTTGVSGRYNAGRRQTASDFSYESARLLLEKKGIKPTEIHLLINITQRADYESPSTACVLQYRLGLPRECIAFDVNLGCSGFVYGINVVASMMQGNHIEKALLLFGDTPAKRKTDEENRISHAEMMLFGDAGGAVILEKTQDSVIYTSSMTDGAGFKSIINPYGGYRNPQKPQEGVGAFCMNDLEVFDFSTREVPVLINQTMDKLNKTARDYDYLVLHQANQLIMNRIVKKTGFYNEQNLVSLDDFGNTSSASIPLTIVKHFGDTDQCQETSFLMCGFGVGLSWGVVDAKINTEDVFPIIHTDNYFEDGYYCE